MIQRYRKFCWEFPGVQLCIRIAQSLYRVGYAIIGAITLGNIFPALVGVSFAAISIFMSFHGYNTVVRLKADAAKGSAIITQPTK